MTHAYLLDYDAISPSGGRYTSTRCVIATSEEDARRELIAALLSHGHQALRLRLLEKKPIHVEGGK